MGVVEALMTTRGRISWSVNRSKQWYVHNKIIASFILLVVGAAAYSGAVNLFENKVGVFTFTAMYPH